MSSKLFNPETSLTSYWSILKKFLNNKKIPCVPLLFRQDELIANFKEKAELLNKFFAFQCAVINNSRELPFSQKMMLQKLSIT